MPGRVSCPWFVGRTAELDALTSALDVAGSGASVTVVIGGDAGIGKSRLVAELAQRATAAGADVLVGACLDLAEGGAPYAPIREVLTSVAARLDDRERRRLLGPDAASDSLRPAEVLPGILVDLGRRRPVVLVLEDLHWADRSTRDLLALLAVGPAVPGLLVVATYRGDDLERGHPLRALLAELQRAARVRHLRLGPFGAADVVEQLNGILGHPPTSELASAVIDRSDGNPFLAEELAAAAGEGDLSPGLRELLLARLDRLDRSAQATLRAAAVGGRRVDHRLLAHVTGLEAWVLAAGLREAIAHHLIVAEGGNYRFRHALVHEVVLGELLPGELAHIHGAYAAAIEQHPELGAPDPSAALVHHWSSAGHKGPALVAAIDAALNAESVYALPEAQRYLEQALVLWGDVVPTDVDPDDLPLTYAEVLQRAGDVASRVGDLARAAELIGQALTTVDARSEPARAGLLHERQGWCLLQTGRVDEALHAYGRAIDLVPPQPPSVARARVLAAYADALDRAERSSAARPRAEEAIAAALAAGSPADEGHARHTLGVALTACGDRAGGLEQLDLALDLAVSGGDVPDAVGVHLHLWRELAQLGRGAELVDRARSGAERARNTGLTVLAGILDGLAAGYCHQLGRWQEADELITASDANRLEGVVHLIVGGLLDVDRGELDRAGNRLEAAKAFTLGLRDGRIDGLLFRALAERAWSRRRATEARELVADGLAKTRDPEMVARLALVGLRVENDDSAGRDALPAVVELVERMRDLDLMARGRCLDTCSEIRAAAATAEAELTVAEGRPDPDAWDEAARRWDALGFPLPAVHARWHGAEALLARPEAGGDRRQRATELMAEAWSTASSLSAAPWTEGIERTARRARLAIGAATEATTSSPDRPFGLTVRELEVLELLGRGDSNRQIAESLFISEKTARVHVSHILGKLAVTSRAQAVDAAHRQGLFRTRQQV